MSVERKYLHNIDLANNKLINPILNPLTTAQRTAVGILLTTLDQGYVCFDTTLNQQYFWNGATWITVTSVTSWGSITGSITSQTDLIAYLAANYYPLATNPANYIDLTDLSAGTGISYNNLTGVITNSAPDQTVALTAGTGIGVTGTYPNFTITNTSPSSGGTVTGSGTLNYIPKWTPTGTALGDSQIFDNGSGVMVNTTTYDYYKLDVNGSARVMTNLVVGPVYPGSILIDTAYGIRVNTPMSGATSTFGVFADGEIQSDSTGAVYYFRSFAKTKATSFTVGDLHHFMVTQGTFGAGSTVTNQYGFRVFSNMIGATNTNRGFFGELPADGTKNWNLWMSGTAPNYIAGGLQIGPNTLGNQSLRIGRAIDAATYVVTSDGAISSGAAAGVTNYVSGLRTTGSFTLQSFTHYLAVEQVTPTTVTSQICFWANNTIISGTNNFGFRGSLPSNTNNWNLYMEGAAKNYLAGNTLIGGTTDSGFKLDVTGTFRTSGQNTLSNLAGSGTRMVVANSTGVLSTQSIPSGTVTSVTATAPLTSSGGTTPDISTSMNTNKLIGRSTAGVGVMEEITVGTGLSLSGGTLSSSVTGGIPHGIAAGTDTYTVTIAGVTSYAEGDAYIVRFTNGNTTSCTLNINGIGAAPLYRNNDGVLIGGDIIDNGDMLCVYDVSLPGFRVIGTAPNTLLGYVTNADSVSITKGQVVYAFGGQGDRMTVKLANNTSDATSARTVGVVLSTSIAPNQKGLIMMQGLLDGLSILPTATWNDGDPVYLGATAGSITPTKPYAPNHLVYVGTVTTASNGSAGRMYVNIQNGYELDELHNVQAQSPALKDTLWYDSTVSPGQWKTASISTILGYTPVGPNDTDYEYLMMASFRTTYNY